MPHDAETSPLLPSSTASSSSSQPVMQENSYTRLHDTDQEEQGKIRLEDSPPASSTSWRLWRSKSYAWSLFALILLLLVFTGLEFAMLKLNLPAVRPEDQDALKFPKNLEDLRRLNAILSVYIDQHFTNVYVTYFITYVYLQSFSIPGSMWLSILGGALFNFWLALFTVSLCSALGATVAFLISASLGSVAVMRLIGERIEKWNEQLVNHKQHMFNYMFVLRVLPLPPNWVINLGAPHLEVPLGAFFWATFLGVAPPSFIHVQAGAALDRLSSSDELQLVTPINVLCLVAVALAALVPVFVRRYYKL